MPSVVRHEDTSQQPTQGKRKEAAKVEETEAPAPKKTPARAKKDDSAS